MFPSEALFGSHVPPEYVPCCDHYAGSERFIRKILALQIKSELCFDVTLDLEDGAELGNPREQRELVSSYLNQYSPDIYARRRGIRFHPVSDPLFYTETTELLPKIYSSIAYITIPKVRDFVEAQQAVKSVLQTLKNHCLSKPLGIHFLIETPSAIPHIAAIASLPCVRGIDFGLMDFVSSYRGSIPFSAISSPDQFENIHVAEIKRAIVCASIGAGKVAAHNVSTDFQKPESAYADALRAKEEFGFQRMWSIHPNQIEPIVRAFTPQTDELHFAQQVLLKAKRANWGPIRFENRLHDRASYRFLWQELLKAWYQQIPFERETTKELFGNFPTRDDH
ncbi:MAG: hypothetical protein KDD64_13720 [Bdellovibrionales bacterium]|nr:hypothetical protein [Bdellovibrionales bacterium]